MKKIVTLTFILCFAPPTMAGSIEYLKCGPFNIRIDRAAGNMFGASFDTTEPSSGGAGLASPPRAHCRPVCAGRIYRHGRPHHC